jgi:hypothetical protein
MTIKQLGGIFGRNPTFNDVDVDGDLSVSGSVVIPNDSISGDAINGGTATLDGLTVDTTTLVVNSTTDSVAINTATPLDRLHIKEDVNSPIATQILLQNEGAGSNTAGIAFQVSASSEIPNTYAPKAAIVFERTNANGGGALKFFSDGTGDATGFQATDEKLRILNTGGITFNGDTAAANALDDYEEGTWTPTVISLTVVGTPTYTGRYTKVGRLVSFDLQIYSTTSTAATSGVTVFSLPFVQAGEPRSYAICSEGSPPTGPILTSYIYPPTWSATQYVWISGTYSV